MSQGEQIRLPTIEKLALHLKVSSSTVRGVFRRLVVDGRLQTIPGRGTFIRNAAEASVAPLILATNIPAFDTAQDPRWDESIYLGAMRMAGRMPRPISIMPVRTRNQNDTPGGDVVSALHDELLRLIDHVDMVMLYPLPGREKVRRAFEGAGKPTVDINPPFISATSNFVSTHFFESGYRMGRAWHLAGRRHLLLVSTPGWESSVSTQLLLSGLSIGFRRDQDPTARLRTVDAGFDSAAAETVVRQALLAPEGKSVDAIFCMGDFQGLGTLAALRSLSRRVPEDVSAVAGTGLASTCLQHPELTVILQPMDQIGANAVRILCHRLENPGEAVPGLYLSASFSKGTTTSAEENLHLLNELPSHFSP